MANLDHLFTRYSSIVVLDTETTGLDPQHDAIIQFCGFRIRRMEGIPTAERVYNELIRLPRGQHVPDAITTLTGITDHDLNARGIHPRQACRDIAELIRGDTLLVAYNAHFDLSFLFHLLRSWGDPGILQGKDKLDLLTVYRDRRTGSHRLAAAIEAYRLEGGCAHRAEEDALAAYHLMLSMAQERDDLHRYLNLFGYDPKYGPPRQPIRSAVYCRQTGLIGRPIYETLTAPPATAPPRQIFTLRDLIALFEADRKNAQREPDYFFTAKRNEEEHI